MFPPTDNLPVVVVACKVFQGLIEKYLPERVRPHITFLDYGLHRVPVKLTHAVQEQLDAIDTPSLVILGYGLCGNGLDGIKAGKHTLVIPKADDCIAILLGSYTSYIQKFEEQPGTYYLTKGWLESGSDPLKEYNEVLDKYGEKEAEWIMDTQYQHYSKLVFIAHTRDDLEEYRPRALKVADYCKRWGMEYDEILGSESYVQELIEIAYNLEKRNGDFVVVPPGGTLEQGKFLR